jgi:hypothetical protein
MNRFERPTGAIQNAADLREGEALWHVWGIWPPQIGEYTVTAAARPFREHREYGEVHSSMADFIVFDVRSKDSKRSQMNFASDGNLVTGHSHNDNYWFRSEAEADAAVAFLTKQWEASGEIAEELARREEDRRSYDYAD